MASVSIGLLNASAEPSVDVTALSESSGPDYAGKRFISIRLSEDVTVIVGGFEDESAAYARTLAAALIAAADDVSPIAVPVGEALP